MYNPDWSRAEMCGKGIRCYMKYLQDNKLTDKNILDVETDIWLLNLKYENNLVTVSMWTPKIIKDLNYETHKLWDFFLIKSDDRTLKFTPISMWNPHAVIYLRKNKVKDFDICKYWKIIENNTSIFPNKTNVEFLDVVSDIEVNMRV